MGISPMKRTLFAVVFALAAILTSGPTWADAARISIGKQQGLSYLPLIIAQGERLIEKHAHDQGLEGVTVDWVYLASATALTDALLSGSVDYLAGASPVLNVLWDKTRKDVKGVVNLSNFDFTLNTINPNVRTVRDFTESDRIAVSAVKLSVHAIILQMAAAQAFGPVQWERLDHLTVSRSHSDGLTAMLSGRSEVTAHLTTPPFQNLELADPRVHRVLSTSEVLGGGGASVLVFTSTKVHDGNPKLTRALIDATADAIDLIRNDRHRAAEIYAATEKTSLSVGQIEAIIADPANEYSVVPRNAVKFAQFQHRIGTLRSRPDSWRDLFFPEAPEGDGRGS
jgi:NitT/TauT family transport system substrate-binding protein